MKRYFIILLLFLMTPAFAKVGSITKANILSNALLKQDYQTIRILINEEPDLLITPNSSGLLPLSLMISRNNTKMVEYLINQGAPIDHSNYGKKPLEQSILLNYDECLEILLTKGADPNMILSRQLYPVHLAALLNRASTMKLLIKYKANVDTQNSKGLTALHIAVQQNNWGMISILADNDANPNILNNQQQTPLLMVLQKDMRPSYFINQFKGKESSIVNTSGKTSPLIYCVQDDSQICVQELLNYGANVNYKDSQGNTALMYAVTSKNKNLVSKLLEYKPDLKITNKSKKTAYQLAVNLELDSIAELLKSNDN